MTGRKRKKKFNLWNKTGKTETIMKTLGNTLTAQKWNKTNILLCTLLRGEDGFHYIHVWQGP